MAIRNWKRVEKNCLFQKHDIHICRRELKPSKTLNFFDTMWVCYGWTDTSAIAISSSACVHADAPKKNYVKDTTSARLVIRLPGKYLFFCIQWNEASKYSSRGWCRWCHRHYTHTVAVAYSGWCRPVQLVNWTCVFFSKTVCLVPCWYKVLHRVWRLRAITFSVCLVPLLTIWTTTAPLWQQETSVYRINETSAE